MRIDALHHQACVRDVAMGHLQVVVPQVYAAPSNRSGEQREHPYLSGLGGGAAGAERRPLAAQQHGDEREGGDLGVRAGPPQVPAQAQRLARGLGPLYPHHFLQHLAEHCAVAAHNSFIRSLN